MTPGERDHLPVALRSLLTPAAYPHPVTAVELVETHVSWILLTGEYAYKIKRPVHYAFIDMRQLERRALLCHEELRLNRRFAPELYLEVCPITVEAGAARIAGTGEIIEYAVRMRQFDRAAELDRLLCSGSVVPDELESFGRSLADLHAALPAAGRLEPWGHPAQIQSLIRANLAEVRSSYQGLCGPVEFYRLESLMQRKLQDALPWFSVRRAHSRVRECHGDLHSRNIVRLGGRLCPFDCMEFEPAFRWIDVADEIALLLADLEARGHPVHANAFLNGYLSQSGDYQACRLLDLYQAHRALVRAKVAALSPMDAASSAARLQRRAEQLQLSDCAVRALSPHGAQLILMCGLAGSGKTWLAKRLAAPLRAVLVRSDRERKRRAGLAAHAHSHSELQQGLYSPQASQDLHRHLAGCTRDILAGGYTAIVDASFLRRADRAQVADVASQLGIRVWIIHCDAPIGLLRERVLQRQRAAADESEADIEVLDWQLTRFEPIRADENMAVMDIETGTGDAPAAVLSRLEPDFARIGNVPDAHEG